MDWGAPPPKHPADNTILVIRSAGAEQGATGNLRIGAEYLGNREYQDMSVFLGDVSQWRKELVYAYEAELMAKNLIPTRG